MSSRGGTSEEKTQVLRNDLSNIIDSLIAEHSEIRHLVNLVDQLKERVHELEKKQEESEVEVMELRDIPRDQAKREIRKYFRDGGYHDIGEVADELRLDIRLVFEICNELIEERTIGE